MPAEETLPTFGLSLALEASRTFGEHVDPGGLGFSAAVLFGLNEPLGHGEFGVTTWPDGLRANPSAQDPSHPHRHWEFFAGAAFFPFDLAPVHIGFFIVLTLANIAATQAERAALGTSVLWSISENCALRYQLGLAVATNLINPALVSSLAVDVLLF
jgi:hypothetical protein